LEAPESATQSIVGVRGVSSMVLKKLARDYGSHSPGHDVQDCDYSFFTQTMTVVAELEEEVTVLGEV
jgi:hypothetical protein